MPMRKKGTNFLVVFFPPPPKKKEQWNYIEIHYKQWCEYVNYQYCESITVSQNPSEWWVLPWLFQRKTPLRSDLSLSPVEQLQCFFPMSGDTTGADGCCITLSIWLQTKASHPHNSMETKLQHHWHSASFNPGLCMVKHGQIRFWTRDIMNFNKFASAWNSQTERNLKSSQALAEHRTPKTEDNVLGMVLQPNCFSSNSSASCQQPATLAAHRAALQVVMLGVRPARIISLAVQMAEKKRCRSLPTSRLQQNQVWSSQGCSCFVPDDSLRCSSGRLLNPPRIKTIRTRLSMSHTAIATPQCSVQRKIGIVNLEKRYTPEIYHGYTGYPKTITLLV